MSGRAWNNTCLLSDSSWRQELKWGTQDWSWGNPRAGCSWGCEGRSHFLSFPSRKITGGSWSSLILILCSQLHFSLWPFHLYQDLVITQGLPQSSKMRPLCPGMWLNHIWKSLLPTEVMFTGFKDWDVEGGIILPPRVALCYGRWKAGEPGIGKDLGRRDGDASGEPSFHCGEVGVGGMRRWEEVRLQGFPLSHLFLSPSQIGCHGDEWQAWGRKRGRLDFSSSGVFTRLWFHAGNTWAH